MSRSVFLSFQHRDLGRARGFDLLRHSPNVDAHYSVRHLLKPVDSSNDHYVSSRIREQLKGTSVSAVLIGRDTASSAWVAKEIQWSIEKGNGLLGIVIDPGARVPDGLTDFGAEIIDWTQPSDTSEFESAIERAALRAKRGALIEASASSGPGTSDCMR